MTCQLSLSSSLIVSLNRLFYCSCSLSPSAVFGVLLDAFSIDSRKCKGPPKCTHIHPHPSPPSISLPHPLHCHLLHHGEKVLLIRTGLSLSAIHHHLTYWSSLLITPSLSLSLTHTHTHTHTCAHIQGA